MQPVWSAAALQQAVIAAWACARISAAAKGVGAQAVPDVQLKQELMDKLKTCPGMRFAPLAAHAQVCRVHHEVLPVPYSTR